MTEPLFGFAKISPKPEFFTVTQNAILDIVDITRAEPGCIQFVVLADADKGDIFLYEEWQDEAALQLHHEKPYIKSVMDKYDEWLAQPLRFEAMAKLR